MSDETLPKTSEEKLNEMPVMDHFKELRRRFIHILAAWAIGLIACFEFAPFFYDWISRPIQDALGSDASLIFISPIEPFFVYLKLSLLAAVFITSPYAFWQVWHFIAPGLYRHEKRTILPIALLSSAVFIAGAVFCYFLVLPLGMKALIAAGQTEDFTATAQISMQSYFALTTRLLLAFGIVFEMPVFSLFLTRLGIITHRTLIAYWRIAVVIIFVIAAILTPPDVITQICLGIPMCALYAVSILLSWLVQKRNPSTVS